MLNLICRTIVYTAYAAAVWGVILFLNSEPEVERVLNYGAIACVSGAVSSFAVLALCRRFRLIGLPEFLGAAIGRTCVPCCFVLACLANLDEQIVRTASFRILAAYFLTAPVHVWLTIPRESEFQRRYLALDEKRQSHATEAGD